jgi:uncharacterized membrane protein YbhN (UPF0104 family)
LNIRPTFDRISARPKTAAAVVGTAALAASVAYLLSAVDLGAIGDTVAAAAGDPLGLLVALAAYALAFVVRAGLWCRTLPGLPFGQSLAAIHVSLAGNHLLPLRLGEPLRVVSAVRRARVPVAAATASTVFLRAADVLAVIAIAAILGPGLAHRLVGDAAIPLAIAAALLLVAAAWWLGRVVRRSGGAMRGWLALAVPGAAAAWLLESVLIWSCAGWAGIAVSPAEAALVTAVTIAAQTVAVAPGGIGTYEAAATAALVGVGADPGAALAAAVTAHAIKTAYALAAGGTGVFAPAPGLLGRLRLATPPHRPPRAAIPPDAPVVLVLPARDEAATVADVVGRAPDAVAGCPVRVVVVDDGSRDDTAALAEAAGARVVSHPVPRGLGAAVRRGLAEGVREGAAAVAFCDADGEYAPEELEAVVAPILAGEADYVVGSRFRGHIRRMTPQRRAGNLALTWMLRAISRTPITDGQSGYRALSLGAARDAEIVHDFNYAQVLTLDLLGKGHRYAEVPIGYAFREHGRSFVRLGGYLRRVVPAVHRELNAPDRRVASGHGDGDALAADGPDGQHGALGRPRRQPQGAAGDGLDLGRREGRPADHDLGLAAGEAGAADGDVRLGGAVALE